MADNINFKTKITSQRPYPSGKTASTTLTSLTKQMESDRGRIINSSAIRRLQQKTQVFPLERNATVRSRLTHSLEVQQTGRFILRTILDSLERTNKIAAYGLTGLERILESIVEMACLSHDIGNPPFGHFGEFAINAWFKNHIDTVLPHSDTNSPLREKFKQDLIHFEGNAQAIRLVHNLLTLNLTYTQTATLLKYVRPAYEEKPGNNSAKAYLRKKPGFYLSEESFVHELWENLNMESETRHPITYIMEAADDISYGLADIEDAVEKGIFSITQLKGELIEKFNENGDVEAKDFYIVNGDKQSFREIIEYAYKRSMKNEINKNNEFFLWLRVNLIHSLVRHAANRFIDNIEDIYAGTFNEPLMEEVNSQTENSPSANVMETLKLIAVQDIFSHKEVENAELQGYTIIYGLIELYSPLLACGEEEFSKLIEDSGERNLYFKRLINRLAGRHINAYKKALLTLPELEKDSYALWEKYYRCRLIQDYISGMTDEYAYDEYRLLTVAD